MSEIVVLEVEQILGPEKFHGEMGDVGGWGGDQRASDELFTWLLTSSRMYGKIWNREEEWAYCQSHR